MDIELLKELIKEHEVSDNTEKLDYIKNLERIKMNLRTKLVEIASQNFGQWYLDVKKDTFQADKNIAHLFTCKNFKDYLKNYENTQQEQIRNLQDNAQFDVQREIRKGNNIHYIQEKITYLQESNLYVGITKDLTQIQKLNKNILNIDKTIYNMMKIFDKNIIIIQCDANGIINYVSSAFCEVSNFCDTNVLGENVASFQDTHKTQNILDIFKSSLEHDTTAKCELKFKKQCGQIFWVQAFISPILHADSQVSYTLVCHDITSQKILEDITNYDSLTGVYNRRYYSEIIYKEINRCKRDKKILSFAMIDIDFFKQYNDSYGHRKGDEVLKQVANVLSEQLQRGDDYLFRMGGEEFCAIFSGYGDTKALEFCEKLKKSVETLKIPHVGSKVSPFVTVSIGLVVTDLNTEVIDELGLYTTSDNALYTAKNNGRNQIYVHPHNTDVDIF